MKFLSVLVLLGAAAASPRPSFCPVSTSIYPCDCYTVRTGEKIDLNLDCSKVSTNAQLQTVFQAKFPVIKFTSLIINPVSPHAGLTAIEPHVFGNVSFQHITIQNTYIRNIYMNGFSSSHESLITLDLSSNKISVFPFEALPAFLHLRIFTLKNNRLMAFSHVESNSLQIMNLEGNTGLTITENTFSGAPELEEIYLNNMNLLHFPPNVFSTLGRLRIIDLSTNGMTGVLQQGVIRVPLDAVIDLRLNNNHLTNISPASITGVHRSVKINFQYNNINSLDWENWFPLLDQLMGMQTIDLRNNQLDCSCDIVWLLMDKNVLDRIHDNTTCYDGTYLKDTDVKDLLTIC